MNQLVYEHDGRRVTIPLESRPLSLGRSPEADHQLPGKAASRIHAQVIIRDGAWLIEDLGSANGTLVNGRRIDSPTVLQPGDLIVLADIRLRFEGDAPRPAAPADNTLARVVYTGEAGAREFVLHDKLTVGRRPDNLLVIDDKVVSGHHCEIENRAGSYIVHDLDSSNGTWVGGKAVRRHALRNGDVILIGKKFELYFIDPLNGTGEAAARAPAPEAQRQPTPAPAMPRAPLERIPEPPPRRRLQPVQLAIGAVICALTLTGGWLVGGLVTQMRQQPKAANGGNALPPLENRALSFEGEIDEQGNPEGWIAGFEAAGNASAELHADDSRPFDGARSLRVSTSGQGTFSLQLRETAGVNTGAHMLATLRLRGDGVRGGALWLGLVNAQGESAPLAIAKLPALEAALWTEFRVPVTLLVPAPQDARLRLMLSGNFERLWLDRLELSIAEQAPLARPFEGAGGYVLTPGAAGPTAVTSPSGLQAALRPMIVGPDLRQWSEADLWATSRVGADGLTLRALLPTRAEVRDVEWRAEAATMPLTAHTGLRLTWRMPQRGAGGFALEVDLPRTPGVQVLVADRRGTPLLLDSAAWHAWPYATITEIMVGETDFALSLPQGAVVAFDTTREGVLGLRLRSAGDIARDGMVLEFFPRPAVFARLYQRVLNEAAALRDVRNMAAARARLQWLTGPGRADADLPQIAQAGLWLAEIEAENQDTRARLRNILAAAQREAAGRAELEVAERETAKFVVEFADDPAVPELREALQRVREQLRVVLAARRTPEDQKRAEAVARTLYGDADTLFKQGNLLLARVMLDTVLKDYRDTAAARDAAALLSELEARMGDLETQSREIDAQLVKIDEEISHRSWARARRMCHELFKRFPDTPRSRDIMQRLRRIEAEFAGD